MSEATANKSIFTTKELVLIAMMTAVTAVCSWISVPLPMHVPVTLQTFAVFCTLALLGGRNGTFSVITYILLGAVGLPVFSGFSGGLSALMSYSGGYITGFLFLALVYWAAERFIGKSVTVRVISLVVGLAVCYAFGTAQFMLITKSGLGYALSACVAPFVLIDLGKMALALIIAERVRKYVGD